MPCFWLSYIQGGHRPATDSGTSCSWAYFNAKTSMTKLCIANSFWVISNTVINQSQRRIQIFKFKGTARLARNLKIWILLCDWLICIANNSKLFAIQSFVIEVFALKYAQLPEVPGSVAGRCPPCIIHVYHKPYYIFNYV